MKIRESGLKFLMYQNYFKIRSYEKIDLYTVDVIIGLLL